MNIDEFETLVIETMDRIRREFDAGNRYLDHEHACLFWLVHYIGEINPSILASVRFEWSPYGRGNMSFPDLLVNLDSGRVVLDLKRHIYKDVDVRQVRSYMERYFASKGLILSFCDTYIGTTGTPERPTRSSIQLSRRFWKTDLGNGLSAYSVFFERPYGFATRRELWPYKPMDNP